MILAFFFLLVQNVLAADEVNICSICQVMCPLESESGVAVTLCAGRHEFCANCLQTWIQTQNDLNYVAKCPLCREELPNAINQPIIPTTCRLARRNFWKGKSKKAFKIWLQWEIKQFKSLSMNQFYYDYLGNWAVAYLIVLSFMFEGPGDLASSSFTLKVPYLLPAVLPLPYVLGLPAVQRVWEVHHEIAAEGYRNRVRRVVSEKFFWMWNYVKDSLHDNRPTLILSLLWVYHYFVYMGGTYTDEVVVLIAPIIHYLYFFWEGYMVLNFYHLPAHFKYCFATFGVVLYVLNEFLYRIIAPTGFFSVTKWIIRWSVWILFKLFFTLVPFIVYHPIYTIYVIYVAFLAKTFFSKINN